MNDVQALKVVKILMAAYEQTWKPSADGIKVYQGVLAVPELDAETVEAVVLEQIRSDERFAPVVGVIYQRALERSREKFRRDFPRLARQIIESSHSGEHPDLLDDEQATAAIKAHPQVSFFKRNANHEIEQAVERYMRAHPDRFPEDRVPLAWRQAAQDFTLTDEIRALARESVPEILDDEIEQRFADFRRWALSRGISPERRATEFADALRGEYERTHPGRRLPAAPLLEAARIRLVEMLHSKIAAAMEAKR